MLGHEAIFRLLSQIDCCLLSSILQPAMNSINTAQAIHTLASFVITKGRLLEHAYHSSNKRSGHLDQQYKCLMRKLERLRAGEYLG